MLLYKCYNRVSLTSYIKFFEVEAANGVNSLELVVLSVYAATASNPVESSYGCYCDSEKFDYTCLGDEFSVAWMEDIDAVR